MRHNIYVLVTLSNSKFPRENPTLPNNKISPIMRATLFSQPIQISPKIRGQPCCPITIEIIKTNLSKSLKIYFSHKYVADLLYDLPISPISPLQTYTYLGSFVRMYMTCHCDPRMYSIVPTTTHVCTQLFPLKHMYMHENLSRPFCATLSTHTIFFLMRLPLSHTCVV
jgi:hypothetical protein